MIPLDENKSKMTHEELSKYDGMTLSCGKHNIKLFKLYMRHWGLTCSYCGGKLS